MYRKICSTRFGSFTYFTNHATLLHKYPNIIFLGTMGINSTYLDFYQIFQYLDDTEFNIISIDMLGSGFSGKPQNKCRSAANYCQEILEVIRQFSPESDFFTVSHSFNATYLLHLMAKNRFLGKGFIGIDPTVPKAMNHHLDEFTSNLREARAANGNEVDINPALPPNLQKAARELYQSISGNPYEISELIEAPKSVELTLSDRVPSTIPTLSVLSTLNYEDYQKWGNPYFNKNSKSAEVVLNGHHFLQWLHPHLIADLILDFANNILY